MSKTALYKSLPALIFFILVIVQNLTGPSLLIKVDPVYIQYQNAIHFIDSGIITDTNHPGIPSTIAMAAIIKLHYILDQNQNSAYSVLNSARIIKHIQYTFICIVMFSLIYFSFAMRHLELEQYFLIHIPFFLTFTLITSTNYVCPRPLLLIFCLLFVVQLIKKNSVGYGISGLLAMTTKLTCIPYILFPYLFSRSKKDILVLVISVVIFIVSVIYYTGGRNLEFILRFSSNSGAYGSEASFIDLALMLANLSYLLQRNPVLFFVWIMLFAFLMKYIKSLNLEDKNLMWGLHLADLVFLFFILRHVPRSYYLVPLIIFLIPKIFILKDQLIQTLVQYKTKLKYGIIALIIPVSYMVNTRIAVIMKNEPEIPTVFIQKFQEIYPNIALDHPHFEALYCNWFGRAANGVTLIDYNSNFLQEMESLSQASNK
jgi:hypothetical protein